MIKDDPSWDDEWLPEDEEDSYYYDERQDDPYYYLEEEDSWGDSWSD